MHSSARAERSPAPATRSSSPSSSAPSDGAGKRPARRRRRGGSGPRPDQATRPDQARTDGLTAESVAPEAPRTPVVVEPVDAADVPDDATFADLGVPDVLVRTLAAQGLTAAFPIQTATLPDTLGGRDVLGRGRTGSGKTLAFAIPTVTRLAASGRRPQPKKPRALVLARPLPTILVGVVGGVVVGITSVGSGSLIIIALMALYPGLKASQLVGTDLVQAVPLVVSAAIAHVLFGDFQLELTTALLIGSVPGVYLGAQLSARAPGGLVRRALAFVLLASALKLLGVGTVETGLALLVLLLVAPPLWMVVRRRHGLPMLARHDVPAGVPSEPTDQAPSAEPGEAPARR